MAKIGAENNLSETAFLVRDGSEADYKLRWFTPTVEVELCGHATIASGHVVIGDADRVTFATRSGLLSVARGDDGKLLLDLPAATVAGHGPDWVREALGVGEGAVIEAHGGENSIIVPLESEAELRALKPDFNRLCDAPGLVIATAPGDRTDIASRVFAGGFGIDEDPVTGAAHAALGPYWAAILGRDTFTAHQASKRGGDLDVSVQGNRVILGGQCVTVIEGTFRI